MRLPMFAAALLATAAVPAAALAQPAPPAANAEVDPRAAVAEVRRVLAERYVLPERRPALDAVLAEGLASGRYDTRDPGRLADLVNADLARVGHDGHLNFNYSPQQAAALGAAPAGDDGPPPEAFIRFARSINQGVRTLEVLPGNVRYMAYDGFFWNGAETAAVLDNAMRFLAGGDAVIIDLRRNGGGSPEAVQYLVSHFLPAGRDLMSFYMNGNATADRTATLAELPAGRMIDKPLYVLTSRGSASAAEEFAGHVAGYRIGELVGETTAGAGFRNELVPVPGGFVLSVSVGRAVLAATGRDWEGVGIAPTIRTPVAGALEVAETHALRRLAAAATEGPDRARLEALAEATQARGEGRTAALPLAAYAGTFGERIVVVENGRLNYRRVDRPLIPLIPLGGNRFALEFDPATRIDFQIEGDRATALDMAPAGTPPQRYGRSG